MAPQLDLLVDSSRQDSIINDVHLRPTDTTTSFYSSDFDLEKQYHENDSSEKDDLLDIVSNPIAPPTPTTTPLTTTLIVLSYPALSTTLILSNKYIITNLSFPFPTTLAFWHLLLATLLTQLLSRTPHLPLPTTPMSTTTYSTTILPISLLFALALILNNAPYLTLSLSFMQMLKGLGPAITLFAAWSLGLESPHLSRVLNIAVIVAGVTLASLGEVHFALSGFLFQIGGLVCDAYRLGLTRRLLVGTKGLGTLQALYYLAPAGAGILAFAGVVGGEWGRVGVEDLRRVGAGMFLVNGGMAFALNIVFVNVVSPIGRWRGLESLVVMLMMIFADPVEGTANDSVVWGVQESGGRGHVGGVLGVGGHVAASLWLCHCELGTVVLFAWSGEDAGTSKASDTAFTTWVYR
ncbi:hypothetical protein C1H76_5962 [Elsinoe australis]|uniref:Sugar phosphate transporter domain-containing protein n=1 Tax=Elsinoe australis TaxID=40998 RepID=A0A4V6DTS9_9PEZI|nr:hypothetical protein C1H76_5962 [Elsinoe australis]